MNATVKEGSVVKKRTNTKHIYMASKCEISQNGPGVLVPGTVLVRPRGQIDCKL